MSTLDANLDFCKLFLFISLPVPFDSDAENYLHLSLLFVYYSDNIQLHISAYFKLYLSFLPNKLLPQSFCCWVENKI